MNAPNQISFYVYLALVLASLLLIFISLLKKNPWILKRAEIKINRIGVDLTVENRSLFVILGIVALLFASFFLYQTDKNIYENAKVEEDRFKFTADKLQELMDETLKMEINIDFDDTDHDFIKSNPNFFKIVALTATYFPNIGEKTIITNDMLQDGTEDFRLHRSEYGISLNVKGIRKDDRLFLKAEYNNTIWSGDIIFPKLQFRLTKHYIEQGGHLEE